MTTDRDERARLVAEAAQLWRRALARRADEGQHSPVRAEGEAA